MEKITHDEYVWPLPNGKRFHFTGDKADAEFIDAAFKDSERYRWLRAYWARVVTDTVWAGVDEPRGVKAIELGAATLGSVDSDSFDRALDRCMAEFVLPNGRVQPATTAGKE